MRRIYLRQLGFIFPVLVGYYGLLSIAHYFALPEDIKLPMMSLSIFAMLVAGVSFVLQRTERIPTAFAHAACIPICLALALNVTAHVFLSDDILQLTNNALAVLGLGWLVLEWRIYTFLNLLISAGIVAYLGTSSSPFVAHFGFMFFSAQVLATLSFINRNTSLRREIMLSLEKKDQNRELERALLQSAAAAEAKSRFLANTSHELRTPLTGIMGMIQLLEKTDLDDNQRDLLGTASGSADGLLRVLNDILDSAALEQGRLSIEVAPFSIVTLVENAVRTWRPHAEEKNLELVNRNQSVEDIWVAGDRVRIGQILFNFMSNALKFTDHGSITLASHYSAGDTVHIEISVSDTGSGIEERKIPALFDRFSQADVTKTREHGGAGLGLAISSDIAQLMGGEIRVHSSVGKGSTFTLVLDLPRAETPEAAVIEVQDEPLDIEQRPMRLLLAEDNPINQALIQKLLKRTGWVTTVVNNGEEAVDAAFSNILPFDLILMDIQMPKMDGITAFEKIREGLHNCPPVIALTANTSSDDIEAYNEAGFSGFVGKPIDPSLLIGEMDRLMKAG